MDRAKNVIDKGIDSAKRMAEDKFGSFKEDKAHHEAAITPAEIPEENVRVTMPDGQIANVQVNIPKEYTSENSGN